MPFLAPVIAFVATPIGSLVAGVALSIGGSLLSSALAPKPPKQKDPGVSLSMQIGGNSPLSFFVGTSATAGHRVYAGTWGTDGETPNAYFVDVLELSNAPLDGLSNVYVNGELGTVRWSEPHAQYGYPIDQGRKDGKDHLWVKFHDGRQTTSDAYLRSKFGSHPERPYDADMVGRGNAYAIVTVRYNRELWQNGAPAMLFEVRGLRLYDIRKDSTAGGSGSHRRNDPSTWEWSDNPYVIAYNVAFMGVYVGSEWLWGLQNLPALRLPMSAWVAAMNEADRALAAWDNQKQFTIGGEITVDMEPAAVLEEIAKSSMGRFIESAGTYKPRCGAPGTSIWSFGEGELLVTDPRTITPFPGLENTHNTVEASYTEPEEAWGSKAAPVMSSTTYIAQDGNRRLSVGLNFPMVSRNEQAQRLAFSYLEDGRRFRQFQAAFHPITWLLEPGDVIDGTILSEGYSGKQFEILEMSGRRTFVQTMTLREIDPSDFDPPASARQPWSVGPIQTIYPPAQPATGISFAPYEFYDNEARARRLGIEGFYQGGMEDIEFFRVEVRRPGETLPFFEGNFPYDEDNDGEVSQPIFSSSFVPDMTVEARGRYVAYSGRDMGWSSWMTVVLPDIKLTSLDVEFEGIAEEVSEFVAEMMDWTIFNTRETIERARRNVLLDVEGSQEAYRDRQSIRQDLTSTFENAEASWTLAIDVATGPNSALAQSVETLMAEVFDPDTGLPATTELVNILMAEVDDHGDEIEAQGNAILALTSTVGDVSAEGLFRVYTSATPSGANARVALSVSATAGGSPATAAMFMDAMSNGTSEIALVAGRVSIVTGTGGGATKYDLFTVSGGVAYISNARIINLTADNIATGAITAGKISAGAINTSNLFVNGVVITDVIAQHSVTEVHTAYTEGFVEIQQNQWVEIQSISVPRGNGWELVVTATAFSENPSTQLPRTLEYQLLRGSGTDVVADGQAYLSPDNSTLARSAAQLPALHYAETSPNTSSNLGFRLRIRASGGSVLFARRYMSVTISKR